MNPNYADHRDRTETAAIKHLEHIGRAMDDKRNAWLLYDTITRIHVKTTDEQTRNTCAFVLLMIEKWTPRPIENEITDTLDVLELYATAQEF